MKCDKIIKDKLAATPREPKLITAKLKKWL
jgi:hypothetical protein